jgi:hypothetical protein
LITNLGGALALGLLYGMFERGVFLSADTRHLLGTGFLGAFTTFSSLAYGGDKLVASGHLLRAVTYFAVSMALGVLSVRLGVTLAEFIVGSRSLILPARARVRATRRPVMPSGVRLGAARGRAPHGHTSPHTLNAPEHAPMAHPHYGGHRTPQIPPALDGDVVIKRTTRRREKV